MRGSFPLRFFRSGEGELVGVSLCYDDIITKGNSSESAEESEIHFL